jgi:hypothetical protein
MKIQVTIDLISRYGKNPPVHEVAELHRKVVEWTDVLRRENNYLGKHMGQHFNMEIHDVTVLSAPGFSNINDREDSPF